MSQETKCFNTPKLNTTQSSLYTSLVAFIWIDCFISFHYSNILPIGFFWRFIRICNIKPQQTFVKLLMLFVYSNIFTNNIHCDITCCSQYILLDGNLWYPFRISTPRMLFTSSILRTKSVFRQGFFDIDFCFVRSHYQITFFKKLGYFVSSFFHYSNKPLQTKFWYFWQ